MRGWAPRWAAWALEFVALAGVVFTAYLAVRNWTEPTIPHGTPFKDTFYASNLLIVVLGCVAVYALTTVGTVIAARRIARGGMAGAEPTQPAWLVNSSLWMMRLFRVSLAWMSAAAVSALIE